MPHKDNEESERTSRRMRILVFGVVIFAFSIEAVGELRVSLRHLKNRLLHRSPQNNKPRE